MNEFSDTVAISDTVGQRQEEQNELYENDLQQVLTRITKRLMYPNYIPFSNTFDLTADSTCAHLDSYVQKYKFISYETVF